MPDRLYLSLWLKEYDHQRVLAALQKVLEAFPFSRPVAGVRSISVHPIDWSEPPAIEREFAEGAEIGYTIEMAREFENPDCAYEATVFWDLWEFRRNGGAGGWRQTPHEVRLIAYGPQFEGREVERGHLELDLGLDTPFLARERSDRDPEAFTDDYASHIQANIQKLLNLVRTLSTTLSAEKRLLWTESGENFAERIERSLR